ncbi:MAG: TPM domain-containing protein [Selenomonadaceae bacterium]|nr:TPM domain-containing protein [Selenomonadaceae bacterium]
MLKKFCAILILIVAASFGTSDAAPSNEKILDASVYDNTGSLSTSEIQALTEKIRAVEQKHGVKIGVEFLDTIGNASIETAAQSLLKRHYSGAQNGGIVFLVDMGQRNWYIATDSRMSNFIPRVSDITGGVKQNLSSGDYFSACSSYIDAVDKSLTYYAQNGSAYDSSAGFNPMAAIVAVIGGICFGMMVRSWLIGGMTNVRHAAAAMDYLKRETVKFKINRDTYLFTNVVRRPKPSGGNGGGGGLGGGGGRGGGGAGGSF